MYVCMINLPLEPCIQVSLYIIRYFHQRGNQSVSDRHVPSAVHNVRMPTDTSTASSTTCSRRDPCLDQSKPPISSVSLAEKNIIKNSKKNPTQKNTLKPPSNNILSY